MRIRSSVKRALGLAVVCITALYGMSAVWGAFAWSGEEEESFEIAFAKPKNILASPMQTLEKPDPFNEDDALEPVPAMRILSRDENSKTIGQGLRALYLADYESDEAALEAWETYQREFPVLNFFQAFAVSKTHDDAEHGISMVAILQQIDLPREAARSILADACSDLQWSGRICAPVQFSLNMNAMTNTLEAVAEQADMVLASAPVPLRHDDVMPEHVQQREEAWARNHKAVYEKAPHENDVSVAALDAIQPSAGLYDLMDGQAVKPGAQMLSPGGDNAFTGQNFSYAADDTVAQAAMRAAYDLVRNRYESAIYDAKMNGGESNLSTDDAMALTQDALASAAERAFEKFLSESLGKRDFEGRSYDGLRGYFVTAFQHAASSSIKSVGRRFVRDVTAGGDFKSLAIRSELLDGLEEDVARAFIDTGLAAAKNSQYAFLRNLEVSYKIRENSKPEYSILTVQPIYSSAGKKHNLFAQGALSYEGGRTGYTAGLGYRYMPQSESYVVGSNAFLDFQRPYNHMRAGLGVDVQTSLWGAAANYYKGLSDWQKTTGIFEERAMDGFDVELTGRMPFLPALEVFGRAYRWKSYDDQDDIDGTELRMEYSPVPAFTLEGLVNDEDGRETEYGLGLRYNYVFGAPSEYLYDWQEQFRQKSPSEYIFSKVRRDNKIRSQERINAEAAAAAGSVAGPGLLTSNPLDGATGLSIGIDVTLTFTADVQAGTGNIVFTDLTDGSDDFTIPVGDPRVTIVNDTVTIDLSAQLLDFLSDYEVTFAAGVFEDLSSNPSPELASGDLNFQTVVDPTAGFPAPTVSMAPGGTSTSHENAQDPGTWQTTIDVGAAPDGVIFESGATGQGIAASFGGGNLVFAAGDGASVATGTDSIFGSIASASVANGLHHFVFVADPDAPSEIGLYVDGIRVINQSIAGNMQSGEWAGTNGAGYGLVNSSIRAGVDTSALTGATLTNNLSFYTNVVPADF